MKQQRIEIVTGEKRIPEIVPVVQRDSGRELHCLITDLKIPAGAVARIYARKPSGKEIYNDCTVLGNTVVVKLTTQMLAETGKVTCQVEISEESSKVSSFAFLLSVEERIDSGSAIESTDEFTALENALWEVEEAAENANAAAGEANKIADTVQQKLDNGEFVGPQGLPGVVDKDTPVEFVQGTEYALPSSGETLGRIIGKTAGDIAILKSGMDSAYILDRINPVTSGSLNDYATPGVYTCINSTIGENITDQPDGKPKAGFKVVVEYVGYPNMILQTITYQGSLLHTYRRIRYDGVWKPWYGGPNNQWDAIGKLADLQTAEKGSLVGAINSVNRDLTEERAVVTGYGLTCTAIKRAGWVRLSVSGTSQEIKSGTQYVTIASLPDGFRPSAQYFQYAIFFNNSAGCVGQFIVYPSGLMAIGYTSKHPGAETYTDIPAGQAVRVEAAFPVEISP